MSINDPNTQKRTAEKIKRLFILPTTPQDHLKASILEETVKAVNTAVQLLNQANKYNKEASLSQILTSGDPEAIKRVPGLAEKAKGALTNAITPLLAANHSLKETKTAELNQEKTEEQHQTPTLRKR